jgi:hypothetical protein
LSLCQERGVPTDQVELPVNTERDTSTGMIGKITIENQWPLEFPGKYRQAVQKSRNVRREKASTTTAAVRDFHQHRGTGANNIIGIWMGMTLAADSLDISGKISMGRANYG